MEQTTVPATRSGRVPVPARTICRTCQRLLMACAQRRRE